MGNSKHDKFEQLSEGFEAMVRGETERPSTEGPSVDAADLFKPAKFDTAAAELTGYSNYSYWGSTLRLFLKNKVSVFLLLFLSLLLVFTFVQPLLPNQLDPVTIYQDPATGVHYRNVKPNEKFWFGTNNIGQDLWNTYGQVRALLCSLGCVSFVTNVVGISLGAIWGYAASGIKQFHRDLQPV